MYYTAPGQNPLIDAVCKAAYPDYHGKKIAIVYTDNSLNMASYWSGGSRDYWTLVRLDTMQTVGIPQQSAFDKQLGGVESFVLPPGIVAVKHCYFCGHDMGLTVYARTDGVKLLPSGDTTPLTSDERAVLSATRGMKSSYASVSDYRKLHLCENGLTSARVDIARATLREKKLLNAANAITVAGKNAIANEKGY